MSIGCCPMITGQVTSSNLHCILTERCTSTRTQSDVAGRHKHFRSRAETTSSAGLLWLTAKPDLQQRGKKLELDSWKKSAFEYFFYFSLISFHVYFIYFLNYSILNHKQVDLVFYNSPLILGNFIMIWRKQQSTPGRICTREFYVILASHDHHRVTRTNKNCGLWGSF